MSGTAVDEKTVKDMESGPPTMTSPKVTLGRSASNASGGADSLRKFGRRNSVSSRHSKASTGAPSPGTPGTPLANTTSSGGIHRSNTVPTKKSPAIASARFQRQGEAVTPASSGPTPPHSATGTFAGRLVAQPAPAPRTPSQSTPPKDDGTSKAAEQSKPADQGLKPETGASPPEKKPSLQNLPSGLAVPPANLKSPSRERKISSLFSRSPILGPRDSDSEQKEGRQPNKLRKKQRIPGSANDSAQSSQNSLHGENIANQTFHTPLASPELMHLARPDPIATYKPPLSSAVATPTAGAPHGIRHTVPSTPQDSQNQEQSLQPPRSPDPSVHSRSSFSDFEGGEDPPAKPSGYRQRWRFSSSAKKNGDSPLAPPPPIGQNAGARGSNSSLGSSHRPRKSPTGDSQQTQQTGTDTSSRANAPQRTSQESSSELTKDSGSEPEKRGLFGKWKAKIAQSKEERKERELEKERTKSPHRGDAESAGSRHSLTAFAQEHLPHRGKSMEQQRENALPVVSEASPGTSPGVGKVEMEVIPPTPVTAIRTGPPGQTGQEAALGVAEGQTPSSVQAPPGTGTGTDIKASEQ